MERMLVIRPEHTQPEGLLLCDETTQKLGFYGAKPTPQRSGKVQRKLVSNLTEQSTITDIANEIRSLTTLVNELRDTLVEKGLIKGSE